MNSENNLANFEDFNLSSSLLKAIKKLGFEKPTQIQEESIPHVVAGKDVVGESATGSGKTLAFGCGAIERSVPKKGLQVLILLPTRELAEQVKTSINQLNPGKVLKMVSIYGGVSITPQMDALRYAEIAIATPGRLKDHIQRGTIDLSKIKLLILDEADRMLDMGFVDDIEDIVKRCPKTRQTLFFSATFPPQVRALTKRYLTDPISIKVKNQVDAKLLKQIYYDTRKGEKLSLLIHLIRKEDSNKIMVFCNTRMNTDLVHQNLLANKIKAEALHGGFTQASRTKVIERFKEGKSNILVCTDVAARGIHVDDVSHVYNYDIPKDSNDYVHRIGRTARAGSEGLVVNLLCDFDHTNFSKVVNNYDFTIKKTPMPEDMERIKFDVPKRPRDSNRGGRGGFGESRGRNSSNSGPGNRSRGRGDFGDSRGRGGSGESRGRSGSGESRGRSGSGESRGKSGFGESRGRSSGSRSSGAGSSGSGNREGRGNFDGNRDSSRAPRRTPSRGPKRPSRN